MRSTTAAAAFLAIVASSSLLGQVPTANTSGLLLGVAISGTTIDLEEFGGDTESGGGGTFRIGYGFTPKFALLLDATAATISASGGDWILSHVDLIGRFHFANPTRAWVPFLELGFTGRVASQDDAQVVDQNGNQREADVEISGGGLSFGGGLLFFFNPKWALSTGLKWTVGEFNTVKFDNVSIEGFEIDATTTRVNIGVSWFPMSRR